MARDVGRVVAVPVSGELLGWNQSDEGVEILEISGDAGSIVCRSEHCCTSQLQGAFSGKRGRHSFISNTVSQGNPIMLKHVNSMAAQ